MFVTATISAAAIRDAAGSSSRTKRTCEVAYHAMKVGHPSGGFHLESDGFTPVEFLNDRLRPNPLSHLS